MTRLLDEKTLARVEHLAAEGRYYDALDLVQDQVEGAIDLGTVSREQMRADLGLALLVAKLDLGAAEYEAWQQAIQWLDRLEEEGGSNLDWCRSLALARLYTGAPQTALELARRGLALDGRDTACRYLAAELTAHFGDRAAAEALLAEGLALSPAQSELEDALTRLRAGEGIEAIEMARLERLGVCPPQSEERARRGLRSPAEEMVLCMLGDADGLEKAAAAFGAENPLFEGIYCFAELRYQGGFVNLRLDMNTQAASKISTDWAQELVRRLEELDRLAKAAIRKKEAGRRLELAHLLIERSGAFRLGYQVGRSREERLFAYQRFDARFVPWGEPEYEDYSADEPPAEELPPESSAAAVPPVAYTKEQKARLLDHLKHWFGPVRRVIPPVETGGVELLVLPPHRQRRWTVLITCGMGACPMTLPPELAGFGAERAEIMMYLPPHWDPDSTDPKEVWPVGWLRLLAAMPRQQGTWLGWGHTIPNGRPFAPGCGFTGVMLLTPANLPDAAAVCPLESGDEINLYQAAPLYNEEMAYKLEQEAEGLLRQLESKGLDPRIPLGTNRPNGCAATGGVPEDEALLEQIEGWNTDRQYERILSAIEAVEPQRRGCRLLGQQARALNNLGRFEEALQVLDKCKEQSAADPLWYFRAGYAWYHLGKEEKALEAFDRADELAPGDEETERYLDWCRSAMALPVQKQPFTERVRDYWAAFSAREQELWQAVQSGDEQRAGQLHDPLLAGVFGAAECSLDVWNGQCRVAVWAECMPTRLLQILYWQEHAPKGLTGRWLVQVGQPADPTAPALEAAQVWAERRGEKAMLALYVPGLCRSRDAAAAAKLLNQAVGEAAALCRVDRLEVLEAPRREPGLPLSGLRRLLADWFCGGDEAGLDAADPMAVNYRDYCYEPSTQEDWALRQDVIAGATCCSELLADYYRGDDSRMDRLQADGVICGFFFYSTEQVPEGQRVELRGRLEDELQQTAGEDLWVLGGATGFAYSYIDCICFDLKTALNAASVLLNRYPFAEIGFHVFRLNCGGVNLRDESAQPPAEQN